MLYIIVTTPADDLNSVFQKFTQKNIDSLPVVRDEDHGILIGMLNRREVIAFYNDKIQELKGQAGRQDTEEEEIPQELRDG